MRRTQRDPASVAERRRQMQEHELPAHHVEERAAARVAEVKHVDRVVGQDLRGLVRVQRKCRLVDGIEGGNEGGFAGR